MTGAGTAESAQSAESAAERSERIRTLARQFTGYLRDQTAIDVRDTGAAGDTDGPGVLLAAFERLDAALAQLADLASIYSDDRRASLEPLVLPTTALAGEYLCHALGATWLPPEPDDPAPDDALVIALPNGIAADLLGVVRAALLSGQPNLTAVARSLLDEPADLSRP